MPRSPRRPNESSSQRYRRLHINAIRDPPDGPWITVPPHTLPSNIVHCPSPNCSGNKRTFKPYWRLNEHMKLRHGWPRKRTQPHLDKRIGNKFGLIGMKNRSRRKSERNSMKENHESGSDLSSGSSLSDPESSEDEEEGDEALLRDAEDTAMNDDADTREDVSMSGDSQPVDDTGSSPNPSSQSGSDADYHDPLMDDEIRRCITEIESLKDAADPAASSTYMSDNHQKLLLGLHDLLNKYGAQVNTIMDTDDGRFISSYYKALSTRAELGHIKSGPPSRVIDMSSLPKAKTSAPNVTTAEQRHRKSPPGATDLTTLEQDAVAILSSTGTKPQKSTKLILHNRGNSNSGSTTPQPTRTEIAPTKTEFAPPPIDPPTASKLKLVLKWRPSQISSQVAPKGPSTG